MSYEFQSMLFRTSADMHAAIAEEYLSAGGANTEADQIEWLSGHSDEECADEAIEGWNLEDPAWAAPRDFSRKDLILAFAVLRMVMK